MANRHEFYTPVDRSENGWIAYCYMCTCIHRVKWMNMADRVPTERNSNLQGFHQQPPKQEAHRFICGITVYTPTKIWMPFITFLFFYISCSSFPSIYQVCLCYYTKPLLLSYFSSNTAGGPQFVLECSLIIIVITVYLPYYPFILVVIDLINPGCNS